ncbi:Zinc finger protein 653 [Frankliniella fusca]|uniref:Zinc finger protein 653 n=1 Tax=Frankliniella fusca TaxID=407009 RepID=A0AAE1HIV6_9NEOP|nr:Zinc finger protein 653 [Frankliniella fusca]
MPEHLFALSAGMGMSIQEYRARIGTFQHGEPKSRNRKNSSVVLHSSSYGFSLSFRSLFVLYCSSYLVLSRTQDLTMPANTSVEKYFQHQKDRHAMIPCMFSECSFKTPTLSLFQVHVTTFHPSKNLTKKIKSYSCPVPACKIPFSHSSFQDHLEKHLAAGDEFICPFSEECKVTHKRQANFRTHLSQFHKVLAALPTKSNEDSQRDKDSQQFPSSSATPSSTPSASQRNEDSQQFPSSSSATPLSATSAHSSSLAPNVIKDNVLKVYLELEGSKVLPSTTVQFISEKIAVFLEMSHSSLKKSLVTELYNLGFDEALICHIAMKTFKDDPIYNIHHKNRSVEQVTSSYLRIQALKKRLLYVPSIEVQLPSRSGKRRVAQYVPIRNMLTVILQDAKVKEEVSKSFSRQQKPTDGILEDFTHGTAFSKHRNHKCIQLISFQDAFEYSPFGPAKGLYKTVGMYFILGNLPAHFRSRVETIMLAFLIQEQYLKQSEIEHLNSINKWAESLCCLIKDLQELHSNGIVIEGITYPVCVIFFTGDNLGQHQIGSYNQSFSAGYVCRYCPMTLKEFKEDPSSSKKLRTSEEYDECCLLAKQKWDKLKQKALSVQKNKKAAQERKLAAGEEVEKKVSNTLVSKNRAVNHLGIKPLPSALNEIPGFHVNLSLVPCLAHDLFEGCVDLVLAKILQHFVKTKGWFSLEVLNQRISSFKCKNQDAADAPNPIKSFDGIKNHAVETWTLLRLLPFMIIDLIEDPEDEYWQLYLSLKEVCEYVCAPKITTKQVFYLRMCIQAFLCEVKRLLPGCLTPKEHFLGHFPDLTLLFGPLIRLFTLRFESRHCFFKQVAKQCKSFVNITLTLAQKYQYRFAFDNLDGFLPPPLVLQSDPEEVSLADFKASTSCELPHCASNKVKVVFDATFNNTLYKNNMWLLLSKIDAIDLEVGRIVKIAIYPEDEVYFIIENHVAKSSGNGYYVISQTVKSLKVINANKLPDYYPLSAYNSPIGEDLCLSFKHSPVFL